MYLKRLKEYSSREFFKRAAKGLLIKKLYKKPYFDPTHGKISIYDIYTPPIEIYPDLGFLLLELPPRYIPMMPSGIGYVNNVLKKCSIRFQAMGANIIFYHRYHSRQILKRARVLATQSGCIM